MRLNMPFLGQDEADAVAMVLATGYLTQGPRTAEFEQLVAEHVGVAHASATSSATTGLHLALAALDVSPGDEVIIPDLSFPATANVIAQQGAIPIFVDITLDDYGMNPDHIEAAITPRTKAIMPVHAFGLVADMDPINAVAERHGIPVVEDAACALGAEYHGRPAGSLGTAGVFSFHPRKVITTGEGGMVVTANASLAERMSVLRSHGAVRGSRYLSFVDVGFNYRLSDVLGAIGVVQMGRLPAILRGRRERAEMYAELLEGIDGVTAPTVPSGRTHTYQSYVVLLDEDIDRDGVIDEMRSRGIETTLGTYSMHLQPVFRERYSISDSAMPNATRAHRSALTIPLYSQLGESDLERVALALRESVSASRKA